MPIYDETEIKKAKERVKWYTTAEYALLGIYNLAMIYLMTQPETAGLGAVMLIAEVSVEAGIQIGRHTW